MSNFGKEVAESAGAGIKTVVFAAVIVAGLGGISYGLYRTFAPLNEQVRYDTFKNSQAYNEGMLKDLYDLQREYTKATPEQQGALRALIQHRFEAYDRNRLPQDLQAFYASINN